MTRNHDPGSPAQRRPGHRLATLALAALLVATAPAAVLANAAGEAGDGGGAAGEPTVDQVVSMLRGGIAEEVVLAWLDAAGRPLPLPSAEQLLALKEAGASDGFLAALIERAPSPPAPAPADLPDPAAAPAPAAPPPPPAAASADPAGVLVRFRLTHRPRTDDGEEAHDLFVYLDGIPLSYVPADDSLFGAAEPLAFARRLEPGVHTLRASLERHREARGGRWEHDARFSPAILRFHLAAGAPAEIEVELREGLLGESRLHLRFEQEERVEELENGGGDPEAWPRLCDDVAADTTRRGARDREWLEQGCVAWNSLWPDGGAPPRDEVRAALARFDYRPVPAGS